MFEDIDKAVENLANKDAGWVDRRDAAEALGEAALRAVSALTAHADESDVDVGSAVQKALDRVRGLGAGGRPGDAAQAKPATYSLEQLVRACEKPGQRTVTPTGDGYVIEVQLKAGRRQIVCVTPYTRKDGIELIRVYTQCGPAREDAVPWALRTNMKLAQCAFALMREGDDAEEQLVLSNCYLAKEATPREVGVAVKEVAYYGDWIEKKLTGLDDF